MKQCYPGQISGMNKSFAGKSDHRAVTSPNPFLKQGPVSSSYCSMRRLQGLHTLYYGTQ